MDVQRRVIIATMSLHNFIKVSNFTDADFVEDFIETQSEDQNNALYEVDEVENADGQHMANIRETIANMLWENHSI